MRRTLNAIILVSLLIAALAGCGGGGGGGGSSSTDVTLNSTNVNVVPGGTFDFSASVEVAWTVVGGGPNGTFNPTNGTNSRYTAPNTAGTYTITATSMADPTKSATAVINVQAASASVVISPDGATPSPGETVQFSANVAVNWSVQEAAGGTISSSGLYKAPSAVGTYHVVATSKADSTKKRTVAVTVANIVNPPPPPGF